ncbi:type II toxin-antitoxin system prevent-host-death family antitoxin [candidate division KSB3 bacterium]|uniref:Antitoxin n=1 Tax=candidate division KSB3 bacterium TaxID=2044937 RepID=A0A9D5Q513_9BACT|nr:type II toxin-antitoxin system prevent-host-death family antitoxin [candidate division KSB3 bacterium]MBD3323848.1 type II toxin-antitoxin system prevent-host-death family antitoxin [candidate division KSB3 bacterium]
MNAITIDEAKENLAQVIEHVIADVEPTIILSTHGEKAVLLSLDEFNAWQETLYLLSNPANAEHVRQSIHEAQTGKIVERELIDE